MIASLLSPTPPNPSGPGPGRMSQLLPSVKCSTCHQPVPLAELGEHTCSAPPPVPSLPKPSMKSSAATSLLPERLQGRVASPVTPRTPLPSTSRVANSPPRGQDSSQHQRLGSAGGGRLKISTNGPGSPTEPRFQPRSSPLARANSGAQDATSPTISPARDPPFPVNPSLSPQRTRPPPSGDFRVGTPSNPGSNYSTPSTARPPISFNEQQPSPLQTGPPLRNGSPFPSSPIRGPGNGPPPPLGGQGMPPPRNAHTPVNNFPPNRNGPPPPASYRGPPPGAPNGMPPPRDRNPSGNLGPPGNMPPPRDRNLSGNLMPPRAMGSIEPPHRDSFVPAAERGIDTKTGGAAGMAGVGRRGFAAAARAAMFVGPTDRPLGPQPQNGRRPNAPQYLDIEAASRSTATPPLSAGSGYSSHSPGPTSPLPQSEYIATPIKEKIPRSPSPSGAFITATPTQTVPLKSSTPVPPPPVMPATSLISPISARLPFFEKFKNKLPGMGGSGEPVSPTNNESANDLSLMSLTESIQKSSAPPIRARANTASSTSSRGGPSMPSRSTSSSTTASRRGKPAAALPPTSPVDSESEYGGLAYADSTDYEDDEEFAERQRKSSPPPPVPPIKSSVLRGATNGHVHFPSVSERDDRTGIRIGGTPKRPTHSRDNSASSYSSTSSAGGDPEHGTRNRANSSAIAHALGLSQTPPSDYAKLGGPGIMGAGGRLGRSISGSSSGSGGKSGYSKGTNGGVKAGIVGGTGSEKAMETLLEDTNAAAGVAAASDEEAFISGLIKNNSTGKKMSFGSSRGGSLRRIDTTSSNASLGEGKGNGIGSGPPSAGGSKAHRSNTIQNPHPATPESKPIKLPMRSLTSPQLERDKALDGSSRMKKPRRPKVCLRCQNSIDDGRWVSVDGGGVLCEKCWKNMYLPKCRRCSLPIEKAAVSSSDGQLKGKYHKECFNCHTCHKPFPDKTFYVYDGKPLCAYHYHEANDSLCAAALCGQPIEGPCAVSHSGDRYHPEHMTCEYPGYPDCRERLNEYWEVDGRMLCERHGLSASRGSDEEGDEERYAKSRAMKRVTRFIDLAGAGGIAGGAAAAAGGGVEGSELR
ncbi:hypothetical protein B0H34DRAFT_795296 [Crassisporium funariophilum]|nr:hypothetical protein B0H34DRAFT_795296 [Crassisporium funariophilum]